MKVFRVVVMLAASAVGMAQAKPKAKAAPMAVWSQDVMRTFAILPSAFATSGLAKMTQPQLDALLVAAKPKSGLTCPVSAGGKTRLLLTVAGDDATDAIRSEIKAAIAGLTDVQLVDALGSADATLRVVVAALTINQKTIGYTASYVVGTPCVRLAGDKRSDVELKGVLGSTMNSKSAGLATNLAGILDKELAGAGR
jgi:hypothetical protein